MREKIYRGEKLETYLSWTWEVHDSAWRKSWKNQAMDSNSILTQNLPPLPAQTEQKLLYSSKEMNHEWELPFRFQFKCE